MPENTPNTPFIFTRMCFILQSLAEHWYFHSLVADHPSACFGMALARRPHRAYMQKITGFSVYSYDAGQGRCLPCCRFYDHDTRMMLHWAINTGGISCKQQAEMEER